MSPVAARAQALFAAADGVLDTAEVEPVHRMRVASRRLRAALEVFAPCFPRKPHRRALCEVKALTRALGERRDRDVAIASLERIAAEMPAPDRRGIATLVESLRVEQAEANRALARVVEPARLEALRAQLDALEEQASGEIDASKLVRKRLDRLRALAPEALDPERVAVQHAMRIAAKRLRYVLELTEQRFGKPAPRARRGARRLQDVLGELHDCDQMLPRVLDHLERLRVRDAVAVRERAGAAEDLDPALARYAPARTAYRGLEVLTVYLQARRSLLYERFRELWAELEERRVWAKLDRALDEAEKSVR